MLNFKGMRFPIDVILICIRWYATYPLSYRHLEEMMQERGVSVDHSTINRWAIRFLPLIEKMARKHKGSVALLIKRQSFPGGPLSGLFRTDHSCQRYL
jgi:transposase-like protein